MSAGALAGRGTEAPEPAAATIVVGDREGNIDKLLRRQAERPQDADVLVQPTRAVAARCAFKARSRARR